MRALNVVEVVACVVGVVTTIVAASISLGRMEGRFAQRCEDLGGIINSGECIAPPRVIDTDKR